MLKNFGMIIDKTVQIILDKHATHFNETKIEKVLCGAAFTAVKLSSGFCGLAKTEHNECAMHRRRDKETPLSPGNICGKKVLDLIQYTGTEGFIEVMKLAAINAISSEIISNSHYHIIENKDPLDLFDFTGKNIAMVGAFCSYIRKLSQVPCTLNVLELDKQAFEDEFLHFYVPAEHSKEIFSEADYAVITGSALANKTMDRLLKEIPEKVTVIVVGPTSGILPELLFEHSVNIIGATRVVDSEKLFSIVSEGGTAYHLFDSGAAQKICVLND